MKSKSFDNPLYLLFLLAITLVTHVSITLSAESNEKSTPSTTTASSQTTVKTLPNITDSSAVTTTTSIPTTNKSIEEAKKKIQEHIDPLHVENRIVVNKPTPTPQFSDYPTDSMEAQVSEATAHFGLNYIKNLPDSKSNVVISPLSLQSLLNMILLGAGDNSTTQKEMVEILGYESSHLIDSNVTYDRLKPHQALRSVSKSIHAATHLNLPLSYSSATSTAGLAAHLQTSTKNNEIPLSGQVNFTLANLVLTNKDLVALKPEYEKELKDLYDVAIEQFSRQPGAKSEMLPLHERVNNWVKNMTQNQIEKLAEESDMSNDDLVMVLLNAAHFKGSWLHTFNTKATYDKIFYNHGNTNEASKVKFMRQKGTFGYADFGIAALQGEISVSDAKTKPSSDSETLLTEDGVGRSGSAERQAPTIELSKEESKRMELTSKLNCSVLLLPFSLNDGQELSMVILLPADRDGINNLQAALDAPALNEVYKSLSDQQVQVEIPKFSFESSYDAREILLKMGMQSIFSDSAKLDRMFQANTTQGRKPKVDKVVHKAKISVDETGAEAAAASMGMIVLRNSLRPVAPAFVADHPFLFVIIHNRSNMPLFMGRVNSL